MRYLEGYFKFCKVQIGKFWSVWLYFMKKGGTAGGRRRLPTIGLSMGIFSSCQVSLIRIVVVDIIAVDISEEVCDNQSATIRPQTFCSRNCIHFNLSLIIQALVFIYFPAFPLFHALHPLSNCFFCGYDHATKFKGQKDVSDDVSDHDVV